MTHTHISRFSLLIPKNFNAPYWHHTKYFARDLQIKDLYIDYINVLDSVEIIKATRGGDHLNHSLTIEENLLDLAYHQRNFEYNTDFAYIIYTPDEKEYIGCFYIYPMGDRTPLTPETEIFDADISFWICKKFYTPEFYNQFWSDLQNFLKAEFPFFKFYCSNIVK